MDISDTLKLSNSLKNFFQEINFFPASVFIIDKNEVILDVNNLTLSLMGCEKEIVIGRNFNEFLDQEYNEKFKKLFKTSRLNFEPQTAEFLIQKPDGTKLNILAMFRFFSDPNSQRQFCFFAMIDYTSQKMKEEIIKRSETRFQSLANTAPVMIWISDVEGLFNFVNKIWLEYTGGEIGQQLGMNWLRNVHPEDFEILLENYQKMISYQSPFTFEFRLRGSNEKYEWMLLKGKPRFSSENIFTGFIGTCFSINDQKEIEAKVNKINAELVEINASKDKLFSIISHDLRSPMSGLIGILDILSTSFDSLEENEKREIISDAVLTSKITYSLMENLLTWSQIQTSKIQSQPERFKIYDLVKNITSLYDNALKIKLIDIKIDIKSDLSIIADKAMTETILRNLISNAIKFTSKEGKIIISSEIIDDSFLIKVSDSGVGIDKEDLSKLFRIDINYSTKGTEREPGTGLGLIICKELIEKQGGKIWVESEKEKGSIFYFTIPRGK